MQDPANLPHVLRIETGLDCTDQVALRYEARFLRRKRLVTQSGLAFLAEFEHATDLPDGAVLILSNGAQIRVSAAPEALLEIRGDLPRLAWHIGNRHTPCQILTDHLRIQHDHVLADMLQGLGAELRQIEAPFFPERGAYGQSRTFGHSHGPHDHGH